MTSNSTINIISDFLSNHNIELNVDDYVYKKVSLGNLINQNIANDIIELIICDSYEVTSPYLKKISNVLFNGFGIHINSNQKNILKKYLIYNLKNDMDVLLESIINHNLKSTNKTDDLFSNNFGKKEFINVCKKIMTTQFNIDKKEAVQKYIYNLNKAISNNNENRIKDYITFLYSRLLGLNELKELSLYDLFILNQDKLIKELSDKEFNLIKKHCANKDKLDRNQAVNLFNQYYLNIIDKNQENPCSLFYLYLNQNLFNEFDNEKSFINYILEIIKQSYIQIQNHKTLSIHISNIINNEGINIKWKLYSFISIFAEKFISYEEKRPYYHPAKICFNILKYQFDDTADITLDMLEEYYKNDDVNVLDVSKDILKTIDYCKNIYTGFTFLDCIVLDLSTILENSTELDCINNKNELLLVFSKNEIDDRKIPCPKCASITISGNSFPEIGIRSWECKNSLCPSRSKTNRGKRYSRKNIYMQSSNSDFSMENIINKNIIKKWRRDIVKDFTDEDLYTMLIKYFTYSGDSITALNSNNIHSFKKIAKNESRKVKDFNIFETYNKELKHDHYNSFFVNGKFVKQFLKINNNNFKKSLPNQTGDKCTIYEGDAFEVLSNLKKDSISNMVTSPPYYNVREYSQWDNLYSYLFDMYNIIRKSHDVLMPGGVFLYNIGDIFDNERIIVHSKMGEKRIPLGAYTILLFLEAGFELLDNVIWDKGETQSNRHMNDGNFTPYYQRPTNCYEHMFIFKKKGDLIINKRLTKKYDNIQKFSPVIKIGKEGVNRYGHTAPFPYDVPQFSINLYTNEGDSVLDPFLGSGTSIIVSNLYKRIGLGIELNSDYAQLAKNKLEQAGIRDIKTIKLM